MENLDLKALYNIGYGLYVITSNDGKKDNGMIGNAVCQITNSDVRVMVAINKDNYSYEVIKNTGILNINCLTKSADFSLFQRFGFHTGKDVDKFVNFDYSKSSNGLAILNENINSYMSLKVETCIDMGTHGMFICSVTEAKTFNRDETMTYSYYQSNVKPKPNTSKKKGFVCKICGYVYEGDTLPDDFVCPICKHPANDFEEIK